MTTQSKFQFSKITKTPLRPLSSSRLRSPSPPRHRRNPSTQTRQKRRAARVKPGTMLFEISGVSKDMAKQALARIAHKMPVRCRFVGRRLSV